MSRTASRTRSTSESSVELSLDLDGSGASEIRTSVVVRGDNLGEAARVVHTAYGLDGETEAVVYAGTGR